MREETDGRVLTQQVRAQMAEKARLPWWYVTAQGLAMLGLLLQAPVSRLTPAASVYAGLGWPIAIVVLLGPLLLRRVRGAELGRAPLATYPSTRRLGITFLVVALVGVLVVNLLARDDLIVSAMVVAVLLAAASTAYQLRENAAIRRDIRDGRITPR